MDNEETFEEKGNGKKTGLIVAGGIVLLLLGAFIGFYLGGGMKDSNNDKVENDEEQQEQNNSDEEKEPEAEEPKDEEKEPEVEEPKDEEQQPEEDNDVISQELLKDLALKVETVDTFTLSIVLGLGDDKENVYSLNYDDTYYMSYLTYNYYLKKSGNKPNKWTSKEASYGPCYKDGQNGYCYIIDKTELLKYDKMLFNLGNQLFENEHLLNGEGYVLLKGDKFYVTDIPFWGGNIDSMSMINVVSAVKNIDNTITYIVNHNYKLTDSSSKNIDIKYTFKLNDNNEYYLFSAVKA